MQIQIANEYKKLCILILSKIIMGFLDYPDIYKIKSCELEVITIWSRITYYLSKARYGLRIFCISQLPFTY